jgi:hypothetical protein
MSLDASQTPRLVGYHARRPQMVGDEPVDLSRAARRSHRTQLPLLVVASPTIPLVKPRPVVRPGTRHVQTLPAVARHHFIVEERGGKEVATIIVIMSGRFSAEHNFRLSLPTLRTFLNVHDEVR